MNTIVRVDLKTGTIKTEQLSDDYKLFAGRALTSKIISDEVDPACDPLGESNKLVFASGLFAGQTVSCVNRLSIGSKSPLTGTIKESNAGGSFALKMGRLGIRAIIFEKIVSDGGPQILYLSKDEVKLLPANEYTHQTVYDSATRIRNRFGEKVGISLVGPAGERLSLAAGIANTDKDGRPSRYCGRGGLGAVMGSKGIKAVVIDDDGTENPIVANEGYFKEVKKEITQEIVNNEQVANSFTKFGTAGLVKLTNSMGALPTHNFSKGSFEKAELINGDELYRLIDERRGEGAHSHACMPGCLIKCSNIFPDEQGKEIVGPLEYETIGLIGSNCGIDSLDVISKINYKCNNLGLDTIDIGGAIAIAMEAGVIEFGDGQKALELVDEIEKDTYIGRIIASGGKRTGEVLGVRRIPACKGQIIPAYDPRAIKGLGVTYATSTMGADHTAGQTIRAQVEHTSPEGQVEASREAQLVNTMLDICGVCFFMASGIKKNFQLLANLVESVYGVECKVENLEAIAENTLAIEKDFNNRAGFSDESDYLPQFFYTEENPDVKTVFDVSKDDMRNIHNH